MVTLGPADGTKDTQSPSDPVGDGLPASGVSEGPSGASRSGCIERCVLLEPGGSGVPAAAGPSPWTTVLSICALEDRAAPACGPLPRCAWVRNCYHCTLGWGEPVVSSGLSSRGALTAGFVFL